MTDNDALEILRKLVRGIDPQTGDALPDDGPCNQVAVVRALHLAIEALQSAPSPTPSKAKTKAADQSKPARAGEPWTADEDRRLREAWDSGINESALAESHQRTCGSISSRLARLGKLLPDNG